MVEKEKKPSSGKKMSKVEQIELAKKLEVLIEKRLGAHYGFSHNGTDSLVSLKIVTSEEKYIRWVKDFLKPYKLPTLRTKKNHGSGMKTTILINIPKISSETKTKIESDFSRITSALVKKKGKMLGVDKKPEQNPEQPNQELVVPAPTKIRRTKKECDHYAFSRFLSKVLAFEGLNFKDLSLTRCDKLFRINSEDAEVLKLIAEASDYYFGKKVSCVVADNNGVGLSFERAGEECEQSQKFNFCYSPVVVDEKDIERRLQRILPSRKYHLTQDGEFVRVVFKSKKVDDLVLALLEMGWNISDPKNGFTVLPRFYKESNDSSQPEIDAKVTEKVSKEDAREVAFQELCTLVESEDFVLLDESLKKEVLDKKEEYLRLKRVEKVTAQARYLLEALGPIIKV